MKKFSLAARSVTFAAIAGLSLGLSAPVSLAAPEVAIQAQAAGNINFDTRGSLTIHKRNLAPQDQPGAAATGVAMDNVNGQPLGGVTFEIRKLDLDLSDPADWARIPASTADVNTVGFDQDFEAKTAVTAEGTGIAAFDDLDLGVYVVTETAAPAGVVRAAPFIVTLPMSNPDGNGWNYNVHAYPKNSTLEAVKEVSDADQQLGQNITYTLRTPIPTLRGDQSVNKYIIRDDYDQDKLTLQPGTIALSIGDNQVPRTHYDVSFDPNEGLLTITFNDFTMLNNPDNQGLQVVTTFEAEVTASGTIVNKGEVVVNNPDTDEDVTTPTNEVVTYYGNVRVIKRSAGENLPLSGAKFNLYRANQAGECVDAELNETTQVTVGEGDAATTEWVTGDNGEVTIRGLHATDFEDNAGGVNKAFCLKEIEAPAGFSTPQGQEAVTRFQVASPERGENGAPSQTIITTDVEVENVKQDTPNLPMTGGIGVGILAAFGAAIVAAGAWFARRNSANA